jgi:hypothetical protein
MARAGYVLRVENADGRDQCVNGAQVVIPQGTATEVFDRFVALEVLGEMAAVAPADTFVTLYRRYEIGVVVYIAERRGAKGAKAAVVAAEGGTVHV